MIYANEPYQTFCYQNGASFKAKGQVDGFLIDPKQPAHFDSTPNDKRPASQRKWFHMPYLVTLSVEEQDAWYAMLTGDNAESERAAWILDREKWLDTYPGGIRFETRCLDEGCWDRATSWGVFPTIEQAIACAKTGPDRRSQ